MKREPSTGEDTAVAIQPKDHNYLPLVALALFLCMTVVGLTVTLKEGNQPAKSNTTVANQQVSVELSKGEKTAFTVPKGYTSAVYANKVEHARDLVFSPGGTLLVSEPESAKVLALPDKNHDGVTDSTKVVVTGGKMPHGLAFYGKYLFVAYTDKLVRYKWDEANLTASFDKELFTTPESGHSRRTLVIYPDGRLYESIGSTCNVCVEDNDFLAAVIESNVNGDNPHVFISGSRNASFLAINPVTNQLWATENSRDLLGDNIPPDEVNILRSGKNYGWPYCYADGIRDVTFNPQTKIDCSTTVNPAYKIQAHSAPLGLAFVASQQFPASWQNDLLVSFHGSWNRSIPTGYKIVHLSVKDNKVTGQEDFISFKNGDYGRPVDLIFDKTGNLYISDDKTGAIYIVQKS